MQIDVTITSGSIQIMYLRQMQQTTSKILIKTINILYYSIVMVMVIFSALILYLSNSGKFIPNSADQTQTYKYLIIVFVLLGAGAAYFMFKLKLAGVDPGL